MDWLADNPWLAWVGLALVLAAIEAATVDFVFIMVAGGALAGAVAAAAGASFPLQVVVAVIVAIVLLIAVRPLLKRHFMDTETDHGIGAPSLVGRSDTVFCDKLDHASIVDGCNLSRARLVRFRHNDMDHLASCLADPAHRGRKLVIVDAVFSMDGDVIDLPEVSRLCRRHGALLMVDEAHSLGVLGAGGRGIEEHFGLPADAVDIKMGTLSKAIPSVGGMVVSGFVTIFIVPCLFSAVEEWKWKRGERAGVPTS